MNYYNNISDDELKSTYKNIICKIKEYDKIILVCEINEELRLAMI